MQMGLLVILTLSIFDFVIGTFFPITDEQRLRGITGYKCNYFYMWNDFILIKYI